jgi:tetratricopeptide (TPR) repeat protein
LSGSILTVAASLVGVTLIGAIVLLAALAAIVVLARAERERQRRAASAGSPAERFLQALPESMLHGAVVLAATGRQQQAVDAYVRVIRGRHPDHAPQAMVGLGLLLRDHFGRYDSAARSLQMAVDTGHRRFATIASHHLGLLLADQLGRRAEAETYLRAAMGAGEPPDFACAAGCALGRVLFEDGRLDEADEVLGEIEDRGQHGQLALAAMSRERHDPDRAETFLRRAVLGDDPALTSTAISELAALLDTRGRHEEAEHWRALPDRSPSDPGGDVGALVDAGLMDEAPTALVHFGDLAAEVGRLDAAESCYRRAIGLGHPETVSIAVARLHALLDGRDGDHQPPPPA